MTERDLTKNQKAVLMEQLGVTAEELEELHLEEQPQLRSENHGSEEEGSDEEGETA